MAGHYFLWRTVALPTLDAERGAKQEAYFLDSPVVEITDQASREDTFSPEQRDVAMNRKSVHDELAAMKEVLCQMHRSSAAQHICFCT